jgi:hypothetical protein
VPFGTTSGAERGKEYVTAATCRRAKAALWLSVPKYSGLRSQPGCYEVSCKGVIENKIQAALTRAMGGELLNF